jgi:hypothetical protein
MGAVFVGRNAAGAVRAIKVPLFEGEDADELRARFEREARTLAKLKPHPNIVRVHGAGTEGPFAFCVLELVEGESLAALIRRGPLPVERALDLGEQVARALAHVHEAGLIHRDVKPENVIVRASDGSAVLMDFGLARDLAEKQRLTRTGTLLGTPAYMAPEQIEGRSDVDHRADVWAAGAVAYELVTGARAFVGASHTEILKHILVDDPQPIAAARPDVARDIETVILRALAKDRLGRYPSASELADDLARARRGEPVHVRRAGLAEGIARRIGRRTARIAGAAVALVLVTAGASSIVAHVRHLEVERAERDARIAGARAKLAEQRTALRGAILAGEAVDPRGVEAALVGLSEAKGDVAEDGDAKLARAETATPAAAREALSKATSIPEPERALVAALCDVREGKAAALRDAFSSLARDLDRSDRKDLRTLAWMGLARAALEARQPRDAVDALTRHALVGAPPELRQPLQLLGRRAAVESLRVALSERKNPSEQQRALADLRQGFGREAWRALARGIVLARAGEADSAAAQDLAHRLFRDDAGVFARDPESARVLGAWLAADVDSDTLRATRAWEMLRVADPSATPPPTLPFKVKEAMFEAQTKGDAALWIELAKGLVTLGWDPEVSSHLTKFLKDGNVFPALRSAADKGDWASELLLAQAFRGLPTLARDSGALSSTRQMSLYDEIVTHSSKAVDAADAGPLAHALALGVRGEARVRLARNEVEAAGNDLSRGAGRDTFARAVEDLRAAIAGKCPKPDAAFDALALGYLIVGRPADAVDAARQAVALAEQRIRLRDDPAALARDGLQMPDLKVTDGAVHARRQLIDALIALDRLDEAEQVARDERDFGRSNFDAWIRLRARVLYTRGTAADLAEASSLFDQDLKASLGLSRIDVIDDLQSLSMTLDLYGKRDRLAPIQKKKAQVSGGQ